MAGGVLALLVVTYTYICFSMTSTTGRPRGFDGHGMLPYRYFLKYYPARLPYTRLLSTHGLSTSELLRTL